MRHWLLLSLILICQNGLAADCQKISSVCVDTAPYKMISGARITLEQAGGCWDFEDTYQCRSRSPIDDCQSLRDRACTQVNTACMSQLEDGSCEYSEQTYQCQTSEATRVEKTVCDRSTFCAEGIAGCFDTSAPPDNDFGKAIAMMEAMREMGTYMDKDNLQIFKGEDNRCSKKIGVSNCCKPSNGGGNMTNAVMAVKAGLSVAGEAADAGSGYLYDALSNNGSTMAPGFKSMVSGLGGDLKFNPSINYMGVGISYGAAPAGSASMGILGGQAHLYFNPTAFYVAVALMVVQEVMKCEKEEQALSMKIGQKLCKQVGSYCSTKTPLGCVIVKETHCCFNSRLARIINEQGRAQLGQGWGDAKNPQCGSLSIADFEKIDFSKMDLAEFIQEITPKMPHITKVADQAKQSSQNLIDKQKISTQVENYYAQ
ncbi:MAG: conjugal transfer protein TraN [Ottowia sp.]|nr:conjugal transfer protein TraN [Ottowia sp.]